MVSPRASATPRRLFARGYTKLTLRIDNEDAIPNFLRALGGDVPPSVLSDALRPLLAVWHPLLIGPRGTATTGGDPRRVGAVMGPDRRAQRCPRRGAPNSQPIRRALAEVVDVPALSGWDDM
jgi:hypothetical protein